MYENITKSREYFVTECLKQIGISMIMRSKNKGYGGPIPFLTFIAGNICQPLHSQEFGPITWNIDCNACMQHCCSDRFE